MTWPGVRKMIEPYPPMLDALAESSCTTTRRAA